MRLFRLFPASTEIRTAIARDVWLPPCGRYLFFLDIDTDDEM